MTATNKEKARQRTQMLVELRKQHSETVKQAQESLKQQQAVRKVLQSAMLNSQHSVPQLAEATGLPAHEVLWHIATMKKYGLVEEAGLDESGEYYLYSLLKETKE